jgi:hypothetical protein
MRFVHPRGKVEHLFKANETCSVLRAVHQVSSPVSKKPGLVLGVRRHSVSSPALRQLYGVFLRDVNGAQSRG